MEAVVCDAFGPLDQLARRSCPSPVPGPSELLCDVLAAGVNFPDGLIVQGRYQTRPALPFVPGSEIAGIVRAVGEAVEGFAVGDRIVAFTGTGAFAEQVAVSAAQAYHLPAGIAPDAAAAILVTYGTAYHALRDRAALASGETLLVLGAAGGVGLAALDLGRAMGARTIAAASAPDKLALCARYGATALIDYTTEDMRARVREITAGGADVGFDPVGGELALAAVKSLAWGGRHLVVGFASGEVPKIPANLLLLKSAASLGVLWGAALKADPAHHAANIAQLLGWVADGTLTPALDRTFPLDRTADAIAHVMERRARGKVVVRIGQESL